MNFTEKVLSVIKKKNSYVCVGLDTDVNRVPKSLYGKSFKRIFLFNRAIIEATEPYAIAYKFNSAFYESAGVTGIEALQESILLVPHTAITILDVKRGDIGSTAEHYASAAFDRFSADAVTVNPYLGLDSLEPFLKYKTKGVFVLCLTSNPGSRDFQQLKLADGNHLYCTVARKITDWNTHSNLGLVVGATHPKELKEIRTIAQDMPFLIPGVGAQQGDLEKTVLAGLGKNKSPILINASRSIIYASSESDFAKAAQEQCKKLQNEINSAADTIKPKKK